MKRSNPNMSKRPLVSEKILPGPEPRAKSRNVPSEPTIGRSGWCAAPPRNRVVGLILGGRFQPRQQRGAEVNHGSCIPELR